MQQGTNRATKLITIGFLWGSQMISYMIRFALAIAAPTLMSLYHIDAKHMGYILSGWSWSYTGALLFVGPIIDRLGPWVVMAVGSLIWGVSTMALPVASAWVSLFAMRLLFGLGHSMIIPVTATSVSRIFPVEERTRAIAVAFSGNQVGPAAGAFIAAFILARLGWQAVFYCLGGATLVMTLAWLAFFPDKRIGRQPPIQQGVQQIAAAERMPWLSLFRYRSTWGIAIGQFGYLYANYFFLSWLPGYLVMERKMTVLNSGIYSALPFWAGMLGTLGGGWLGDFLIRRGVRTTVSRKSIIGISLIAFTLLLMAAAYAETIWLTVTLLTLCGGLLRMATASANSTPIDLAPRSVVATLTSIQCCFGNVGGLLAPIVTGYIVSSTGSFFNSFIVAGGMALLGFVGYVLIMGNLESGLMQPKPSAGALRSAPSGVA